MTTSAYCPREPGRSAGPRKSTALLVTKVQSPSRMKRLETPVLPTAFVEPDHVRGFPMSSAVRDLRQLRTEAFVDQRLHLAFRRILIRRSVTILAPLGGLVARLGRPRGGVAWA